MGRSTRGNPCGKEGQKVWERHMTEGGFQNFGHDWLGVGWVAAPPL